MTHTLSHFAGKAATLRNEINSKVEAALALDRQLVAANDEIDVLRSQLSEIEQSAAGVGHSVASLHEAIDRQKMFLGGGSELQKIVDRADKDGVDPKRLFLEGSFPVYADNLKAADKPKKRAGK